MRDSGQMAMIMSKPIEWKQNRSNEKLKIKKRERRPEYIDMGRQVVLKTPMESIASGDNRGPLSTELQTTTMQSEGP